MCLTTPISRAPGILFLFSVVSSGFVPVVLMTLVYSCVPDVVFLNLFEEISRGLDDIFFQRRFTFPSVLLSPGVLGLLQFNSRC